MSVINDFEKQFTSVEQAKAVADKLIKAQLESSWLPSRSKSGPDPRLIAALRCLSKQGFSIKFLNPEFSLND